MSGDVCKHGESGCGTYYDCGKCKREKHERIWSGMTQEQRNYDKFVDPLGVYTSGLSRSSYAANAREYDEGLSGCSCHICAPCSFCTSKSDEEDE